MDVEFEADFGLEQKANELLQAKRLKEEEKACTEGVGNQFLV